MAFVFRPVCSLASNEFHRDSMLGMDRESNGWRAYALELWAESRERSLMNFARGRNASPDWVSSGKLKKTDM